MHMKIALCLAICLVLGAGVSCSHYSAGNRYAAQKEYEKAAAEYQQALQKDPEHVRARIRLGYVYFKSTAYNKALDEFTRVLESDSDNHYALFYAGLTELAEGNPNKALSYWDRYSNSQLLITEAVRKAADTIRNTRQEAAEVEGQKLAREIEDSVALAATRQYHMDKDDAYGRLRIREEDEGNAYFGQDVAPIQTGMLPKRPYLP